LTLRGSRCCCRSGRAAAGTGLPETVPGLIESGCETDPVRPKILVQLALANLIFYCAKD
jgi:hypothetical protein